MKPRSLLCALALLFLYSDCQGGILQPGRRRNRNRARFGKQNTPQCTLPSSIIIVAASKNAKFGSCFADSSLGAAIKDCTSGLPPTQSLRKEDGEGKVLSRQRRFNGAVLRRVGEFIMAAIPSDFKSVADTFLKTVIAPLIPQDYRGFVTVDTIIQLFTNIELWKVLIEELLGQDTDDEFREYVPKGLSGNMRCLDQCVLEKAGLLGSNMKPDEGKVLSLLDRHAGNGKKEWTSEETAQKFRQCMREQEQDERLRKCSTNQCQDSTIAAQCMLDVLGTLCGVIKK